MSALLFLDVESTGLSPDHHALVEIGVIAVIDGEVKDARNFRLRPHEGAKIDPKAMDITGFTIQEINSFDNPISAINDFIAWMDSFDCKFRLAGHNIGFDKRFLYRTFCRHGFYSSYITRFRSDYICTYEMAKKIGKKKLKTDSLKLGELCSHLGIELKKAHSASDDIQATLELYNKLSEMLPKEEKRERTFNSYHDMRSHYLDTSFVQFNPDGDIYINSKTTKDPQALRFILSEIYAMYGDEGVISDSESPSSG